MRQVLPVTLLGLAICLPSHSQWQRLVSSGKGEVKDEPAPHPLSYFTSNPFLRDDGDEFCEICLTPEGKAESAKRYSIRTAVEPVGILAGFKIVDALYYVKPIGKPDSSTVNWKSILVQVAPDSYREIFHLQAFYTTISIGRSQIIQSGRERVLASTDSDGGNGGGCWQDYWWFDSAGPHSLDFSRLQAAIDKQVPQNTRFSISCSNLNLQTEQVQSGVQKLDARCHACDWIGQVTARFRLSGFVVEPEEITYQPDDH